MVHLPPIMEVFNQNDYPQLAVAFISRFISQTSIQPKFFSQRTNYLMGYQGLHPRQPVSISTSPSIIRKHCFPIPAMHFTCRNGLIWQRMSCASQKTLPLVIFLVGLGIRCPQIRNSLVYQIHRIGVYLKTTEDASFET
jgi:hypothetical protein